MWVGQVWAGQVRVGGCICLVGMNICLWATRGIMIWLWTVKEPYSSFNMKLLQ